MASGVQVADDCLTAFRELKLGKAHKYIIFSLNSASTEIIVEKRSKESNYDEFLKDLPPGQCKWAVYDFEFEKEGKRTKLCFIAWCPDDAKIRPKMVFASSRDALRRRLDGIAVEIQGTDPSEVSYETVLSKAQLNTR